MSADRDKMVAVLKQSVVPELRRRGFKGSFPHFRRPCEISIHLLTFQFDRNGGGFVVEIAKCSPNGTTMSWGEHVGPNKVTAHDINDPRPRLGVKGEWFRYDTSIDDGRFERAAQKLLPYLDSQAEPWWKHDQEFEGLD
jgi:hypothetical protein